MIGRDERAYAAGVVRTGEIRGGDGRGPLPSRGNAALVAGEQDHMAAVKPGEHGAIVLTAQSEEDAFKGLATGLKGTTIPDGELLDEDIEYRLDALLVGMERIRSRGLTTIPRAILLGFFGDERQLRHPRVQSRLQELEKAGRIQVVGGEECYLRITGRLA